LTTKLTPYGADSSPLRRIFVDSACGLTCEDAPTWTGVDPAAETANLPAQPTDVRILPRPTRAKLLFRWGAAAKRKSWSLGPTTQLTTIR